MRKIRGSVGLLGLISYLWSEIKLGVCFDILLAMQVIMKNKTTFIQFINHVSLSDKMRQEDISQESRKLVISHFSLILQKPTDY